MLREEIAKLIGKATGQKPAEIKIEHPENEAHGDYSTNIALVIAKKTKKNPIEIAENISSKFKVQSLKFLDKVEVVKPGFINFFVSKEYLQGQVKEVLKEKERFGQLKIGKGKKINVEFISANPTGPLTLGNGRGGFCGDVLSNVLVKAGFKVVREYYINDIGVQIGKLGHSVMKDEQAVYKGEYIDELAKKIKGKDADKVGKVAAKMLLEKKIKLTVKRMAIDFDVWFSEKSLYDKKEVKDVLNFLKKKKLSPSLSLFLFPLSIKRINYYPQDNYPRQV